MKRPLADAYGDSGCAADEEEEEDSGGAAGGAASALTTATSFSPRKKNDAYRLSAAARATLGLTAVVVVMAVLHRVLQHSHRQFCSRNFINAVLFANSETCVMMDGSMAFIEASCGYLIKTGVASGMCVMYSLCTWLVSDCSGGGGRRGGDDAGSKNKWTSSPPPTAYGYGSHRATTTATRGGDNWNLARSLAASLSSAAA